MLQVTTSWDDGDALDVKLALLLNLYGLKGTFYVTKAYRPHRLSENAIRTIAQTHEIGAHTLTHPDLRKLSPEQQREEIVGGKRWLEEVLGKEIPTFCYPSGRFDDVSVQLAREAGFVGARTTEGGRIDQAEDSYRIPTTLQVYPFPLRKVSAIRYAWRYLLQPLWERGPMLCRLGVNVLTMHSWQATARATFDIALARGEVFHLWGHSWEIEQYGMWEELERFLAYCKNKGGYRPVVNGDLIKKS